MINYKLGETGCYNPLPLKKEHRPRCSFSVTPVMPLSFSCFRNIDPLSWSGPFQTLGLRHLPSIILDNKHINHNFMRKHFIVVQNSRGKFQNLAQYLSVQFVDLHPHGCLVILAHCFSWTYPLCA
jgi:hypothetical protein